MRAKWGEIYCWILEVRLLLQCVFVQIASGVSPIVGVN